MQIMNTTNAYYTDEYNPVDRTLVKIVFGGLYLVSFLFSFLGNNSVY